MRNQIAFGLLTVPVVGCTKGEPVDVSRYKERFEYVETIHSPQVVMVIMGQQPDDEQSIEVLGFSRKQKI